MAKKKRGSRSLKTVVEQDMPGWAVVEKEAAARADKGKTARAKAVPDAVSPGVNALKAKATGKTTARAAKPKRAKSKAQFVVVTPKDRLDAPPGASKVALVRDGKVVARQG